MQVCNNVIIEHLQSSVSLIPRLASYLIAAGGKRLRPLLTIASARLSGYHPKENEHWRHVDIAACVEFIHSATLLHDDVVDESKLRRGAPSANAIFGNQAPILVGDFLFARTFQILTADGCVPIMAILSKASATLAEGEVMQMMTQNDLSTSIEQYQQVIFGKTAALFAAACEAGAVVASAKQAYCQALHNYGKNLGMAFQLVDDMLDYIAHQADLGKTVGDDFREGKVTLPVLMAFQEGSDDEKTFWRRVIEDNDQKSGDLEHALALIAKHKTIAKTRDMAKKYAREARESLSIFEDCQLKQLLQRTADYVLERSV